MKNLDLNTMSKEDLQELGGISPHLAEDIIQFRDEHGGIDDLEELREISGVDDATLESIRSAGTGGERGGPKSRQSRGGDAHGSGGERGR